MKETEIYKTNISSAIEDVANWRATMESKLEKLPDEHPAYRSIERDLNKCWYLMEDVDTALTRAVRQLDSEAK